LKHVLIDTDPGIDDALALLLAFSSPELRIEGLTTVAGNGSLNLGSLNALKLLDFLGVENVPVAAGRASEEPRCPSRMAAWMSGAPSSSSSRKWTSWAET